MKRRTTTGYILLLGFVVSLLSGCVQPHTNQVGQQITPSGRLPTEPLLRIENGMHTAAITAVDMDKRRRFILTASLDKTARLWEASTGRLLSIFRVPSGYGRLGTLESCAISPDGSTVAVGGWTGPKNGNKSIYLFDAASGSLVRQLDEIPSVIFGLAFSKDGRFLAAVTGRGGGLYVWNTTTWTMAFHDNEYEEETHGMDFDTRGRLVTASYDGFVRLYAPDFHLITMRGLAGGREPANACFSSDGKLVAVGFNDSTRINILSGVDLSYQYTPETGKIGKGSLAAVGWSLDGKTLYAGGKRAKGDGWQFLQWSGRGKKPCRPMTAPVTDNMAAIYPFARNRLLVATHDPTLTVMGKHDRPIWINRAASADFYGPPDRLLLAPDCGDVQLSISSGGKRKTITFSLTEKGAKVHQGRIKNLHLQPPATHSGELAITGWQHRNYRHYTVPAMNNKPVNLEKFESSMSAAVRAGGTGCILGTDRYLRAYDQQGLLLWKQPVQSCWAVNISANGRVVVAALRDSTIRWYRWEDGGEIMALYTEQDGRDWVLWTPGGFFDHSPGGEKLVGFQINKGWRQVPDFISIEQMYNSLYRPDLFVHGFFTDNQRYLVASRNMDVKKVIAAGLPPKVILDIAHTKTSKATVKARVQVFPGDGGLGKVIYRVNGIARVEETADKVKKQGNKLTLEKELPLEPGKNSIEVSAYNRSNEIESKPARFTVTRLSGRKGRSEKPSLFLLAIAVSDYRDHALQLRYPVADAKSFSQSLQHSAKKLFKTIMVKTLFDNEVTGKKLAVTFKQLAAEMQPDDVFVLYVAGHGLAADGNYYFVPWDLIYKNEQSVVKQGISRDDLLSFLSLIPANKAVILLDTCNAGAFAGGISRGLGEKAAIAKLTRATGRATIMASTDKQAAYEGYKGHGVFTWTLIEALRGQADRRGNRNGIITINELAEFVMEEVPKITLQKWNYEQFPLQNLTGRSFPLGMVR